MTSRRARVAVVGHVEWVDFARVDRVPKPGEIAHGSGVFAEPAGGGGVAAVQLARLAGRAELFCALGDDEIAEHALERLGELGVTVHAARRPGQPTRRALTMVDGDGERTIVTLGERLAAAGADPLPWDHLAAMDAVYFTAGDADALRAARGARVLVASPRADLGGDVSLDALVLSAHDDLERERAQRVGDRAGVVVLTDGAHGGAWHGPAGGEHRYRPAPTPETIGDTYGCGDSFAAGFTYGLGMGMSVDDALELAARCGSDCLQGRGPFERQLTL